MFGMFISLWVFLITWALPGRTPADALSASGGFLFYWTAFWSFSIVALITFFLLVGGTVLLRLPPPMRNLAAPFLLAGGVRAFFSKPVFVWVGSVALMLAGAWTLKSQIVQSDALLGVWLIAVGQMARSYAWTSLKGQAKVRVFGGGISPGGFQSATPHEAEGGAHTSQAEPEVLAPDSVDSSRFERAEVVETVEVSSVDEQTSADSRGK